LEEALQGLLKTLAELFARMAFQRLLGSFFGAGGPLANVLGGGAPAAALGSANAAGAPIFQANAAAHQGGSSNRVAVDVSVEPSPLLTVTWERRAVAAEERAIARGPIVARSNNQRFAIP
jgi:hypothetical protein